MSSCMKIIQFIYLGFYVAFNTDVDVTCLLNGVLNLCFIRIWIREGELHQGMGVTVEE